MRRLLLALLFLLLSACTPGRDVAIPTGTPALTPSLSPSPALPAWELVWADEFELPDGSPPDPASWNYSTGGGGWGNGELQHYTDRLENARIEDGNLVITALQETYMGRHYTSARLNTMVKREFQYGRIEVRARLPNTPGIWPAIWMLPARATYGTWPAGGEIDILELIGREPFRAYATLHYGNPHESQSGYYDLPGGATFDQDFHVFAIEWEPDEIRWYVDDVQYHAAREWFTSIADYPAPFDQPFYLILNVAVGGHWPGSPDETSLFPQSMRVDYVRVYQERE